MRLIKTVMSTKRFDMEAVEMALRDAIHAAGARILETLLAEIGCGRREEPVICSCGCVMHSLGCKSKTILTILGEVVFTRSRYVCDACGGVRYPGDEELDVVGTTRSPGLRRMMSRSGSKETFKEGREDLKVYAGIEVSAKDMERVSEGVGAEIEEWGKRERAEALAREVFGRAVKTIPKMYVEYDGTGVPMTREELKGRKGKQSDGTARTREAKLGCVFTQTTVDEKGLPIREPGTTTFVGAIETAEEFGWRIYGEAGRRGLEQAQIVVILGDGAVWIWSLAELHFPGAILIVDLYHAKEHVADLCRLLWADDEKQATHHRIRWWTDLEAGKVEKIIEEAQSRRIENPKAMEAIGREIGYLEKNKEKMRYADFRAQGLFVGSCGGGV